MDFDEKNIEEKLRELAKLQREQVGTWSEPSPEREQEFLAALHRTNAKEQTARPEELSFSKTRENDSYMDTLAAWFRRITFPLYSHNTSRPYYIAAATVVGLGIVVFAVSYLVPLRKASSVDLAKKSTGLNTSNSIQLAQNTLSKSVQQPTAIQVATVKTTNIQPNNPAPQNLNAVVQNQQPTSAKVNEPTTVPQATNALAENSSPTATKTVVQNNPTAGQSKKGQPGKLANNSNMLGQTRILAMAGTSKKVNATSHSSATAADSKVYVVQSKDTLYRISKQNAVKVSSLMAANKLKSDHIRVGQKLKIPKK